MKQLNSPLRSAGILSTAFLVAVGASASAQNVGIGTTTPKSKLSVNGSTASGGLAIGDASYTSTTGTVAPLNGAIIQGNTGIGMSAPVYTLQVHANADQSASVGENIIAEFNPLGGQNAAKAASIVVNSRAGFGYALDLEQSKYAFLRGNENTDVRLQVVDGNAVLHSDSFFMSSSATTPGFIGINTEAPQSRLDIRGTTKIMPTTGTQTGNFWNGTSNVNGFEVTANAATGDAYVGIQREGLGSPLCLSKPAGAAVGDSFVHFIVNATTVGTISRTAGGVAYNTTSDERLKENIRPSAKGLDDLMKIQVRDYNYKANPNRAETGFIAQQLNTVFPDAVTAGGEDPKEKPWTVDYGRVTPVLVKAIQEQQAEIEALKAENAKLKAQAEQFGVLAARMESLEKLVAVKSVGTSRQEAMATK